ncbi:type I polyketide synthase [Segnochrobactrum spirostomi]|uniref:Aminotransferase class III-fold pyridoxal phosphate-dependent enzyme n=1 Tax=Segnochrobactrum spirostomi TaxID=2608987 RepID=A0A6A7Y2G0_9HYPH|nr:aminotransferase class III-fold pyridoxal phosphate-dependent enzyme [Segnochrobactrum spirostomi]MQT12557.1 aminotransferase class III-fold pyridoxal phosphate-dependent enzyme [Segnochrobactrum spirostomi]
MSSDSDRRTDLSHRLARLRPEQIADLLLGLESRLDGARQEAARAAEPIAIVGMSARFASAASVEDFAALLFSGTGAVRPAPGDRPERDGLCPAGYVDGIDRFDAGFFGLRSDEADAMDPQHRLALMLAWHALEDAGYADAARRPRETGIFLGLGTNDYETRFHVGEALPPSAILGNARSIAAGRISHWLDVTGPALAIDTACSSSLVAVHLACRSLRAGECDLTLAGGLNLILDPDLTEGLAAAGMLSPSHACHTFDAAADGYVRGEGGGLVVLKRLSDARRDGDRIRAVVRGSAINHDGHASALTAPNRSAQIAVVTAALADARLAPSDVQVVECHGTGTPLGDPIEVQALAESYGPGRTAPLLLGAVKTNIGHLEAAAGIAGLIKNVLALEAGRLPATVRHGKPNPRIAWDRLPVKVVDREMPWPAAAVRRAAVSSFGFSGTNAHVVLEAAPEVQAEAVSARPLPFILPLAAPDREGLKRLAGAVAAALGAEGGPSLDAVAAALTIGRGRFRERAAIVAADRATAIVALTAIAEGGEPALGATGTAPAEPGKIAFLFSGQGSQWAGMAADLYQRDAAFRAIVDRGAAHLGDTLAAPLTDLLFDPEGQERQTETANAQPALFVLEYALAERLSAWGVRPDIVAGHSLGEWVAACVAGVLAFEDALDLVVARGRLMGAQPHDGAMLAVFAPAEAVERHIAAHAPAVGIAAFNAPDEIVVSGSTDAVAALSADLEAAGIGHQRLRTSHAFHSHLMEPALAPFEAAVREVPLAAPRLPLVSNVTGTTDAPFTDPAYWARQIRAPVRFTEGMAAIAAQGAAVVVEVGPAATLLALAQRTPAFAAETTRFVPLMRRNRAAAETLALALCRLYCAGLDIIWPGLPANARRASLPGYPFADEIRWIARPARAAALTPQALAPQAAAAALTTAITRTTSAAPAKPLDPEEVRAAVLTSLGRTLQLDAAALGSDLGFFSLGVDSLALTEAVATLEKRWKIAIPRIEVFETLTTPHLLTERIVAAVVARPAETSAEPAAPAIRGAVPPAPSQQPVAAPAAPAVAAPPTDARAQAFISDFAARYVARSPASRAQRATYGRVLADSRAVAGFRTDTKAMLYPIIGVKGVGSHIVDADGNDYVDLTMGFGVQLFGHNPSFTVAAMQRQIAEQGLFLGPQAQKAGDAAARISRVTGNERVVFCNSGTEAVMTALRLARHKTGRTLVAMFAGSYHGHFDGTLARSAADGASAPLASGTPNGMLSDVLVLDYADPEGSRAILAEVADRLAAVIVEPVQSRRPSLQPREFLQWLRGFTEATGVALIFDEVLLGFRVALGGAQAWAGVQADIVTYGKIVGGGLPIGVVAGKRDYLDGIDGGTWSFDGDGGPTAERTFFAGTFNKNPLTMALSVAVLEHLEAEGPALQTRLNARTGELCRRLNAMLEDEGSALRVEHFASLFRFSGASDLFYNQLIANGVYVWEGRTCFLSTAHTAEDLDRVVDAVRASARALGAVGLIPAAARPPAKIAVPPAPGQKALWVLSAFSVESAAAYNQTLVITFDRTPDVAALNAALGDLVARHDSLRTAFSESGEETFVHRRAAITLETAGAADEEAAARRLAADAARPFDLTAAPLLRATLVTFPDGRAALDLVQPHIITDGWSMQVTANDLARLYTARVRGAIPDLPPAPRYADFAAFANTAATDPAAEAHWRATFETAPAPLALPTDRPRPPLQTFAGARLEARLPAALAARLSERARSLGCSLFTLCLGAYGRLLADLTGQDDLAIAIFAAGQPMIGEPGLTGYCISTVPVRLALPQGADGIAAARAAMTRAMAYPAYPLSSIVKAAQVRRDPARPPLASVSFNLDKVEALAPFADIATRVRANEHGSVRWDLNWNLLADTDGLLIEATYNRDLFDAARVEGWIARYEAILRGLLGDTETVAPPSSVAEPVASLADHVARWAVERPDAAALIDRVGTLTWRDLAAESGNLAARLAAMGVQAGDRVALCLERGAGPVVGMIAASHLGAAFVPLDPDHPATHRAGIVADSGAKALVIDETVSGPHPDVPVIVWSRGGQAAEPPPRAAVQKDDLAYILFTSGSTGRPKGVMVPCGAVETYARAMLDRLAVPAPAAFGIVTSFAADLGYTSVVGALVSGGTLHAIDAATARDPDALIAWTRRTPIDVLKIVPSHLSALLTAPDATALLPRRALVSGGDVLTFDLVDRLHALSPTLRVFNHYGPTETTIGCTMVEVTDTVPRGEAGRVPVGYPLGDAVVEIVDEAGAVLPPGETAEIRVRGSGVALGYVGRDPREPSGFRTLASGERCYLTGDLGSRDAGGLVTFLGRNDDMVKIRGYRVDPNGVAVAIRGCPGVADAAVVVDRTAPGGARLVAAVVGTNLDTASLGARLVDLLPEAHRPAVLGLVDALPLNANGKVDRQAILARLAPPETPREPSATPDAEVMGEPLATVLRLWREVLGRDAIGPNEDFFALGGDSIMAIQLAGKARAAGWLISPTQIFAHATAARLALVAKPVEAAAKADRGPVAGPVPPTPIQRWFHGIAMPDRRHWALTAIFELPDAVSEGTLAEALATAIARHDSLRTAIAGPAGAEYQDVVATAPSLMLERVASEGIAHLASAENELANRLIGHLDLASGALVAAGIAAAPGVRHLVIAAHHWAFDIVSWGILADDIAAAIATPPRPVAPPPTAWSWWCATMDGEAERFDGELDYWRGIEARHVVPIPLDKPTARDLEGAADLVESHHERTRAEPVLGGLSRRYGLQTHESVLALVARAVCRWAGGPVLLDLESHGREPLDPTIDLSRTIGWFTARYPLATPDLALDDVEGWLKALKEDVRAVPHHGLGYGLLRYARGAPLSARPTVSFNFLGEIGRFGQSGLKLVRLGAGRERDPKAERPHRLAFNAWQEGGALAIRCEFGAGHAADSIDALMAGLRKELDLLGEAAEGGGSVYTPSDFTGIAMSEDELAALVADLDS